MPVPTIAPLPTPPARSDAPVDFSAKADAFAAALPRFGGDANELAEFTNQRAIDADDSAQAAAASEAASEADREEVALNTAAVASNTATVAALADEVAEDRIAVAENAQKSADDAQLVVAALASVADGPVVSINNMTGVVKLEPLSLVGPGDIYITQAVEFVITDYDSFRGYVVQASAGSASLSGDTITLTAPGEPGPLTLTVFAGEYQRDIELDILPESPAAPVITSPDPAGVMGDPLLAAGPFELIGPNTDTHAATDWEVWTGPGRTGELVWSSIGNTVDLRSIRMPDILAVSSYYYMSARYAGEIFGYGEWAELAFRTADQFLPTVIGQPFGGGFYFGKIKIDGDTYALIDAGKASETSLAWKDANTATTGTASLNDGLANSNAMNNAAHAAAQYCRAYNGGGFDDWYLGSKDENELRYRNLKPDSTANHTSSGANTNSVPPGSNYTAGSPGQTSVEAFKAGGPEAFTTPDYYWTSTEYSATSAWIQRFSDGYQNYSTKTTAFLVRPVRRLKI